MNFFKEGISSNLDYNKKSEEKYIIDDITENYGNTQYKLDFDEE